MEKIIYPIIFILILAVFVWFVDGYLMWKRRATKLKKLIEVGDLNAAIKFISFWRDS